MAWSIVQSAKATGGSGNATVAFPGNVASGHLLLALLRHGGTSTINAPTDTLGTSWSLVTSTPGPGPSGALYAATASSSGADTISVTFASSSSYGIAIVEISGQLSATADVTASNQSTAASISVGPTTGIAVAQELVVACVGVGPSASGFSFPPTGYTDITNATTTAPFDIAYLVDATAGDTESARWTWTTSQGAFSLIASFQPASGLTDPFPLVYSQIVPQQTVYRL